MKRCKFRTLGFKSGALLEIIFLTLLIEEPSYGYKLVEKAGEFGIPPELVEKGVAYRILRKLETLELVKSEWQIPEEGGTPKRVYTVTDEGKNILKKWVVQIKKQQEYISHLVDVIEKNMGQIEES